MLGGDNGKSNRLLEKFKNKPLRDLAPSTLPHQFKSESLLSFVDNVTALLKWLGLQAEFFVKRTRDTLTIITMRPNFCETRTIFTK